MFSVPSKNALLRVLVPRSRLRLALAAAATAALFVWAPFWSAVWLGPVVWIVAAVLVPFASPWSAFDYAVPLEHWNDMYQGKFRTAGVTAKSGPRGPTPPVYANGWYKIAESEEVPPLGIKNVRFMGSDLVLFRGPSGQLGLVDAYCPHLGAHLGVGGTVTPEVCLQVIKMGLNIVFTDDCLSVRSTGGGLRRTGDVWRFPIRAAAFPPRPRRGPIASWRLIVRC